MSHSDEVEGRAFANFMKDAMKYFVKQDIPMRYRYVNRFMDEIERTWRHMTEYEKRHYLETAQHQINAYRNRWNRIHRVIDEILDEADIRR